MSIANKPMWTAWNICPSILVIIALSYNIASMGCLCFITIASVL